MTYTKSDYGTRAPIWEECLEGICLKFKKLYSYPAQKTLLLLADKYHGLKCSLRTLNRDLRRMEDEGRMRRKRRLTRKGINRGRFTSTMYFLRRLAFKSAARLAKWGERVLSLSRLPNLANNKSQRENEIFKEVAPNVENLWKSPIQGRPTP